MNIYANITKFADNQLSLAKDQKQDFCISLGMITGYLTALVDSCQITPIEHSAYLYSYGLELVKLLDNGTDKDAAAIKEAESLKAAANKLLNGFEV